MSIIILEGTAQWAFVHKPREAFGKFGWSIDVQVDDKSLKVALKEGIAKAQKKITSENGDVMYKTVDPATVRTYKAVKRKDGSTNKPPLVVDSSNEATNVMIGNGSKVRVQVKTFPWTFKKGTGCELMSIQVLDLVEFSENVPEFEVVADGFKADVIKDIGTEEEKDKDDSKSGESVDF